MDERPIKSPPKKKPSPASIRQKAERRLQPSHKPISDMSPDEIRHLVHEFEVHQIELEIQNEELRETQLALESARDRYASLFDFSPVGYVALNHHEKIMEANLRFCQLIGANRKDLLHQKFIRFVDPGDQPMFRRHLEALTKSADPQASKVLTLRGANNLHRVRLESCMEMMPALSQESLYRMAVVDVTEEEAVLRLNANILQSTKEGIYGIDPRGCFTFVNRSCEEFTGWKFSDLCGRSSHDVLHHTRPDGSPYPREECPVLQTLHHGRSVSIQTDFLWRKNGTSFPAEFASTPILNESGHVEGAVVTFRDITERKRAETLLQDSRDQLAQQQIELQGLTAKLFKVQEEEREKISRELHDDISQRLALLQMKIQIALPSQGDQNIQEIADDIGTLSNDVRKIIYGFHPYILQDLGVEAAIRSLVAEYMKCEQFLITLSTRNVPRNFPPDISTCVYRIAQEIFHNISKHAQATSVRCELIGEAEGLTLMVQDDGVGFTRAESASNSLGLIGMQERAKTFNGQVTIDSNPGKGTKVELWIPWQEN